MEGIKRQILTKLKSKDPETADKFKLFLKGKVQSGHIFVIIPLFLAKSMDLSYIIPFMIKLKPEDHDYILAANYDGDESAFHLDLWLNTLLSFFCGFVALYSLHLANESTRWMELASLIAPLSTLMMVGPLPTYTISDLLVLMIPQNIIINTSLYYCLFSIPRFLFVLLAMIGYNIYLIQLIVGKDELLRNVPNLIPYVSIYTASSFMGYLKFHESNLESFTQTQLTDVIGQEYKNIIEIFPQGLLITKDYDSDKPEFVYGNEKIIKFFQSFLNSDLSLNAVLEQGSNYKGFKIFDFDDQDK